MKAPPPGTKVRRSVVLATALVDEVRGAAPPEMRDNLNRLVVVALEEYARNRRREAFEASMARMAADPDVVAASRRMTEDFGCAEADGLPDDPPR